MKRPHKWLIRISQSLDDRFMLYIYTRLAVLQALQSLKYQKSLVFTSEDTHQNGNPKQETCRHTAAGTQILDWTDSEALPQGELRS